MYTCAKIMISPLTIIVNYVDHSINLHSRRHNIAPLQCWLIRWKGDDNFKGFQLLYDLIINDSDHDTLPSLITRQDKCWNIRVKVLFT